MIQWSLNVNRNVNANSFGEENLFLFLDKMSTITWFSFELKLCFFITA
ncbi:unnamed protein product [Trichobilharzia regenti]|nr:unnamed protein product [Trichobilharzia regenti]